MIRTTCYLTCAGLALAFGALFACSQRAEAARPPLFANYYVGPTVSGEGVPARLYPSPRPTPPLVGHTYVTYPPFMPHEYLYHHHRTYYKYYPGGGYTTAKVWWY